MQWLALELLVGLALLAGGRGDVVERMTAGVVEQLDQELSRLAEDPDEYARLVAAECRGFPEGDLFPYTLPVLAWAGLTSGDRNAADLARMERLLELAEKPVAKRTSAPEGRLDRLENYRDQATYLCQLNLAAAAFVAAGGKGHFAELHDKLSEVILSDLEKAAGRPLNSFPSYTWPFDTVPCLLSVADHVVPDSDLAAVPRGTPARGLEEEQAEGNARGGAGLSRRVQAVLDLHLAWVEESGLDRDTSLPVSRVTPQASTASEGPRGCDLSWRLALLEPIAPETARRWYKRYVKAFWVERVAVAGFREWPEGVGRKADVDSGPIVLGIGGAATALGIASAQVFNDELRLARLVPQVETTHQAIAEKVRDGEAAMPGLPVKLRADRYTGFLYGDVVLFHALTWGRTAKLFRGRR